MEVFILKRLPKVSNRTWKRGISLFWRFYLIFSLIGMMPFFEDFLIIDFNFLNEIQLQEDDKSETDGMKIPLLMGSQYHKCFSQENSITHSNETFGTLGVHLDIQSQYSIPGWADTRWPYRKNITIDASKVMADLTNFPVLIELYDSDLYSAAQADGDDIVFTNSIGDQLDHEIEVFNPNYNSTHAHLVTWLKSNLSSSQNTLISMYYGNNTVSSQQHIEGVWGGDYSAILHLNDDFLDSTFNNNTGTNNGSTNNLGRIANGQSFDGNDDFINVGSDISIANVFSGGGIISAWIYPTGWGGTDYGRIFDKATETSGANGWTMCIDGNVPGHQMMFFRDFDISRGAWSTPENSINLNQWQYVVVSYDDSADSNVPSIYINGVPQTLVEDDIPSGSAVNDSVQSLYIGHFVGGGRTFNGTIDEVRISNKGKSAAWIATEFNNQFDPLNFYAIGIQEHLPGNSPPVISDLSLTPSPLYSNDDLTLNYVYYDADGDPEVAVEIRWFKNGLLQSAYNDSLIITASSLMKGDIWNATVKTYDGLNWSDLQTTSTIMVLNSPPVVSNVTINGFNSSVTLAFDADLVVGYTFTDNDGDPEDIPSRKILWYRNGILIASLNDCPVVTAGNTSSGEVWYYTIRVFDGSDYSNVVFSPSASIDAAPNTPPVVSNLTLTPFPLYKNDDLTLDYDYYDADGDFEVAAEIRWFKNGLLQSTYNDFFTIPASALLKGDMWNATVRSFDGLDWSELQSITTIVQNTPPTVSNSSISPSAPYTTDDLIASYESIDIDGDSITAVSFEWLLDGVHQSEFDNSTIIPMENTSKGHTWCVRIKVFDGEDWSSSVDSFPIFISNSPPSVTNVALTGGTTTSDPLQVTYTWYDDDSEDSDTLTIITWENSGTYLQDTYSTTLSANETTAGEQWWVTITPYDGEEYGDAYNSLSYGLSIIIGNTPPELAQSNIDIKGEINGTEYSGQSFGTLFDLKLYYNATDIDGDQGVPTYGLNIVDGFALGSEYRWYRNRSGVIALIAVLNDETTISQIYTEEGDFWWVQIRPRDLYGDFGIPVNSSMITIGNTAPQILNFQWDKSKYYTDDNLSFTYMFFDYDSGDVEQGRIIQWFRNGEYLAGHENSSILSSQYIAKNDSVYIRIQVWDGGSYSNWFTSQTTNIQNSAPVALNVVLIPISPNTSQILSTSWIFLDIDNDSEAQPIINWFRNGILVDSLMNVSNVPSTATNRDESWYFSIQVSDGTNYSSLYISNTVVIINSAPTASNIQINAASATIYTTDPLIVTWDFIDPDPLDIEDISSVLILWYLDGVEQVQFMNQSVISANYTLKNQEWFVSIRVRDNGGLTSDFGNSSVVVIANSPPIINNLVLSPSYPNETENLVANWDYDDADGDPETISFITWYKNGVEQLAYMNLNIIPSSETADGEDWYFNVHVSDGTSNSTLEISPHVVIGTSLLVLNIESPTNTTYSTTTISINLSGNVEHFWYFIEGVDTVNQSWTASLDRIIDDGTYTFHAYGNDSADNIIHVQSTFNIDTTPPELIILSPINAIYGTEVLIDLSGDDDTIWLIYNIEGVNIQNQSWVKPVNVSLSDGYHQLHAYSSDSAGNIAYETIFFTVDSILPIVTIIRPSDNLEIPMKSESIKIVWSVVDSSSFSEAEILVNGSFVTRVPFPCCVVEITLPEGLHNIEVVVYDLAGNRGSAMITVLVDYQETETDKSDASTGFSVIFPLLSLIAFTLLLRRRLIISIRKEE